MSIGGGLLVLQSLDYPIRQHSASSRVDTLLSYSSVRSPLAKPAFQWLAKNLKMVGWYTNKNRSLCIQAIIFITFTMMVLNQSKLVAFSLYYTTISSHGTQYEWTSSMTIIGQVRVYIATEYHIPPMSGRVRLHHCRAAHLYAFSCHRSFFSTLKNCPRQTFILKLTSRWIVDQYRQFHQTDFKWCPVKAGSNHTWTSPY